MENRVLRDLYLRLLAGALMLACLLSFFFFNPAQAQMPTIVPLNDSSAMVTHLSLPFLIDGVTVKERTATIQSTLGSCKVMLDPFRKDNFLVKCAQPDQFTVQLWVRSEFGEHNIQYGPVAVTLITDQTVVTPQPQDPRFAQGQQLFAALCATCHSKDGALRPLQGRTASQITTAIASVPSMSGIVLTTTEKNAIAFYLGN